MDRRTTMTFKEFGEMKKREEKNELELRDILDTKKEVSSLLSFSLALGYLVLGSAAVGIGISYKVIVTALLLL